MDNGNCRDRLFGAFDILWIWHCNWRKRNSPNRRIRSIHNLSEFADGERNDRNGAIASRAIRDRNSHNQKRGNLPLGYCAMRKLLLLLILAPALHAQNVYGPNAYRNGYGL